jgi:hypothetical protein
MQGRTGSPASTTRKEWWWIFDPRCSLRGRAALLVGTGIVAFTLLISWITGTVYRRALENQLANAFETLAFQVGDKLDRAVYERYRTLQHASSLAVIRDPASPPAEQRRVLDLLQETFVEFAWIGLTDASGRVVAATNRLFEGTEMESRPWFRSAREIPHIGPLREFAELAREIPPSGDGEPSNRFLDLAVPVTGSSGQFAGVLAAHVRWNWSREVQTSVVPESAASRKQIGVTVYGPGRDVLLDSGASGWTQPPDAPSMGEGRRFRGAMIERAGAGIAYLTGFSRSSGFRDYRGLGWITVIRQPVERAFADVAPLRRAIVLWGGMLAVMGSVAGWIIAGRHAQRLRSVRAAAERIHEGDILSVLPRPKDESELAGMCGALGDLVEDLRAQKEKLTAENARLAAHVRENDASRH